MTTTTTTSALVLDYPDVTGLAVASFLARYREPTLSAYTQDLKAYLGWCQAYDREVLRVTRASSRCTSPHLESRGYAAATIARRFGTVSTFYKYAVIDGVIPANPAVAVTRPKVAWEAIAALLGRHSLDMTLRYAKIANRTVADEYFAVTNKVEALYGKPPVLPADAAGPGMARIRRDQFRMLGNGYCTRPPELDCAFESVCETCTFFQTSIEFRPTIQAQHDDAVTKAQTHRAQLFDTLLDRIDRDAS